MSPTPSLGDMDDLDKMMVGVRCTIEYSRGNHE